MSEAERERIQVGDVSPTTWRRLGNYLRGVRWPLAGAVALTLVVTLSNLAGPYIIGEAIDGPMAERNARGLYLYFGLYVGAYALHWSAAYLQTFLTAKLGQDVIYQVREDVFVHIQRLSMRFYEDRSIGRILSRLTNDVQAINRMVTNSITTFFSQSVVLVAIVAIMLYEHARLALICFTVIPLACIVVFFIGKRLRLGYHAVRRKIADVNASLEENISGMREVQAFCREETNREAFRQLNEENLDANMDVARLSAMFWPSVDVLSVVGTVLVLWFGGWMIFEGTLTVGRLVIFLSYVDRFFHPVRQLSEVVNTVQSALASAERLSQYLDEEPEVEETATPLALGTVAGAVTFDGVTFGYEQDQPVLCDISFELQAGETAALVGPTGAGKTTITSLLARFYDPWQGEIRVDSTPIDQVGLRDLRQHMAVVLQDNILFAGTIMDNVRFGRPGASDEEVVAACKLVRAHELIASLPAGYQTEVREGGKRLSAGQRQLVAFARALVANRPILILDEATSDIDVYTEARLQAGIETLLNERTALIIAHRLSTIRRADRILVLADGRLVEQGSHGELLRQGGLYHTLYRSQMALETDQFSDLAEAE